jgi:hypothetical protein
MVSRINKIVVLIVLFFGFQAIHADAQKATELYIPIGQSPGLSGVHTIIGSVVQVDEMDTFIVVLADETLHRVQIRPQDCIGCGGTWIYIDRSHQKRRNDYGYFEDFEVGDYVEVKFRDNIAQRTAEWVKIRGK